MADRTLRLSADQVRALREVMLSIDLSGRQILAPLARRRAVFPSFRSETSARATSRCSPRSRNPNFYDVDGCRRQRWAKVIVLRSRADNFLPKAHLYSTRYTSAPTLPLIHALPIATLPVVSLRHPSVRRTPAHSVDSISAQPSPSSLWMVLLFENRRPSGVELLEAAAWSRVLRIIPRRLHELPSERHRVQSVAVVVFVRKSRVRRTSPTRADLTTMRAIGKKSPKRARVPRAFTRKHKEAGEMEDVDEDLCITGAEESGTASCAGYMLTIPRNSNPPIGRRTSSCAPCYKDPRATSTTSSANPGSQG